MSKEERTWPKLVFIYIMDEIGPRLKRNELDWKDISHPLIVKAFTLVALKEFNKMIDRKTARQMMDKMFEIIKRGDND